MNIELTDVVQSNVDRDLNRLYTTLPAIITDVSKLQSDNVVSVQPAIQKALTDGYSYNMPILIDMPIQWPAGGGAVMTFPLEVGDDVKLSFSMMSMSEWWLGSGIVKPFDRRLHNLSDAFVIPSVFRDGNNPAPHPDNVEIKYGDSKISINKDGTQAAIVSDTWSVTNGTGELIDLLTQTLQTLSDTTVNTVYGVSPLNNKVAIDALIVQLETFKE